ncbi:MAG: hypothetical protein KA116_13090 [Proteobacteria bacterium]|jgi:hypothetical protein|nr:hypothetical protein [Pseudomonadota bacterium]
MSSKLSPHLKSVIDQFTPEILGVFWITNEELSRNLSGFDDFNYLFDGLISQYLYGQDAQDAGENKTIPRSNIFFTQNFNQKLFLAHIRQDGEIDGVLDEQIALIQENKRDRHRILIFNKTSKNWVQDLSKRYSQFHFTALERADS